MTVTRSQSRIGYVSSVYSSWLSEPSMRLYSLNAQVCANWQWNARHCVTGLHSWLRRSCNPVTQSRAFHCHFAHTRAFSIFSQTYCVQTELRWPLYNEFYTKKFIHTRYTESILWFSWGHFYFVDSWLVCHTAWENIFKFVFENLRAQAQGVPHQPRYYDFWVLGTITSSC